MKVIHKLTIVYILGLGFLVFIVLVASFSFNDIYSSTKKILELTEEFALRHREISPANADEFSNTLIGIKLIRTRIYIFFAIAMLLSSLGIPLIIYIYRKNIAEPLHQIVSVTQKMAQGQFERLYVESGTEIGTLAENFNFMGQTLANKINELKEVVHREQDVIRTLNILNELNSSIIFKLNADEVLETIVLFSNNIIKSEIGAILLIDKESRQITHFASSLPKERGDITRLANNIVYELINNIIPIRLSASSGDKKFIDITEKTHMEINNFMAVPVMIGGEPLGALILINKIDADEFTMKDEDIALMVSFQGAIAIEKSLIHEEMVQLAKTDGLTGLNNHRTFHEDLEEEITRARRFNRNLALLLIDFDYLKKFNDTYGHQGGDTALRQFSGIIRRNSRSIDSAARYGGDEFAVILPETHLEGAVKTAERIINETNMHSFNILDTKAHLTVSIGVSIFSDDAISKEGLIKAADDALYLAKRTGGNRAVTFQKYKAEASK